jgi:hypothetical protein
MAPSVRFSDHFHTFEGWASSCLSKHVMKNVTGFLIMLATLAPMHAAELKPETADAWDAYVASADAAMKSRLHSGAPFLWIDEAPEGRQQLRDGNIIVTSVGEHNPKKVPSGLIHHWMGAAFFPNAKVDDVIATLRDYDHYKTYYNPSVIDARLVRQTESGDRFSMVMLNKSFFLKKALESEYRASYERVSDGRWYSISNSIRVQEIEDYGKDTERKLRAGEGSGYIWRLHSIARFEEADRGVYVEMEALALSRDVPAAARWVVDPIVRRVSKSAITTSLRQTQAAVNQSAPVVTGRTGNTPRMSSGFRQ